MIFLGFLFEGRFQLSGDRWEFDLLMGKPWEDILDICNTNLGWEELGYEDVSPESVIEDVITKGANVMFELLKQYDEEPPPSEPDNSIQVAGGGNQEVVEEVETVVIEEPVTYYEPYTYDPFYVSPIWAVPLFIASVILW